jgi:uncharacterized protein (TIGR02147 family)
MQNQLYSRRQFGAFFDEIVTCAQREHNNWTSGSCIGCYDRAMKHEETLSSFNPPSLVNYLSLTQFLDDLYRHRKLKEKNFSYETWAQELEIKSRSFLRLVVQGKRPLTETVLELLIKNTPSLKCEERYARLLFRYQTSNQPLMREMYGKELIKYWKQFHEQTLEVADPGLFLSHPLVPALYAYLTVSQVGVQIEKIAEKLKASSNEVQQGLDILRRLNLLDIELDADHDMNLRLKSSHLKVPSNPGDRSLAQFHMDGLEQARAAHDLPFAERKFRSLLVPLSESQIQQAQELINEFAKNVISGLTRPENENSAKIYRLNVQLFPISEEIETTP